MQYRIAITGETFSVSPAIIMRLRGLYLIDNLFGTGLNVVIAPTNPRQLIAEF